MLKWFLKDKNGQVGITITWFVAFIVIFFILLLFVGIVATIAVQKGVGKNEISLVEGGFNKIEQERNLITFLNSFVIVDGKNEDMKYLIFNKKIEELKSELKRFVDGIEPKPACYILRSGDGSLEIKELFGLGGRRNNRSFVDSFLREKGIEIYIFDNGKKIKLEFYIGEC